MDLSEKCLEKETIYKGVVEFRRDKVLLQNGNTTHREFMLHPGACAIVALDENENIYLEKQFRYPFNKVFIEIPAGKLDKGEEIATCAKRELKEETGLTCENLEYLGCICPSIAFSDEVIHIYLAKGLNCENQKLDDDEFLEVFKVPFDEALEMVMNGEITDAKSVCGILKYAQLKNAKKD